MTTYRIATTTLVYRLMLKSAPNQKLANMLHVPDDDLIRNHIILTPNGDYVQQMLKLCEHCVKRNKIVLLMTQHQLCLSRTLEKPRSLVHMERWMNVKLKDIESAPRCIIELPNCVNRPDLIIFDMYAIVRELISRPVLQQCGRTTLVRQIAKCAAAFCNYLDMLRTQKRPRALDAVVVMPTESYPLTPAQFKLLIGLYFSGNELHTSFAALSERIRILHELQ